MTLTLHNNADPIADDKIYLYAAFMRGWQILHFARTYAR